jgi:hypothetical protein
MAAYTTNRGQWAEPQLPAPVASYTQTAATPKPDPVVQQPVPTVIGSNPPAATPAAPNIYGQSGMTDGQSFNDWGIEWAQKNNVGGYDAQSNAGQEGLVSGVIQKQVAAPPPVTPAVNVKQYVEPPPAKTQAEEIAGVQANISAGKITQAQARQQFGDAAVDNALAKGVHFYGVQPQSVNQAAEVAGVQANIDAQKMTEAQARAQFGDEAIINAMAKGVKFHAEATPSPTPTPTPTPAALVAPVVERAAVEKWNVTPEQTVKRQVNDIIAEDSPLMQQARAGALMQANERGLVNSSMAAGAAQAAVMDKAIQIGGQDANTYSQAAQTNAGAANTNSMFNAGQSNQWNTNQLDRDFTKSERIDSQGWQTSERKDSQNWQSGENSADRTWKSGESAADRNFTSTERKDSQNWQTGENTATRTATSAEKALDRQAQVEAYKFDATTQKELKDLSVKYQKELDSDAAFNDQYKMYVDALYKIDQNTEITDPKAKQLMKYQAAVAFESYAKLKGLKLDLDFSGQFKADEPSAADNEPPVYNDYGLVSSNLRGRGNN